MEKNYIASVDYSLPHDSYESNIAVEPVYQGTWELHRSGWCFGMAVCGDEAKMRSFLSFKLVWIFPLVFLLDNRYTPNRKPKMVEL